MSFLGVALENLGYSEEADEAYRRAIAIDPNYAIPYCNLGNIFYKFGRFGEAIEVYRRAIVMDPWFSSPHYGLGTSFERTNRPKEAIEAYNAFLNLADKETGLFFIEQAKERIVKLQKRLPQSHSL